MPPVKGCPSLVAEPCVVNEKLLQVGFFPSFLPRYLVRHLGWVIHAALVDYSGNGVD